MLSRTQVAPLLSDFGRRAQDQALHPQQRLDLSAPPVPSSSPTATPSPPNVPAVDCLHVKCVALTFDDGPGPYTASLLATLARHGARATFFVTGQNATYHADLIRQEAAAGHEIGNHSWSHPDLTRLSTRQAHDQLGRTDQAVQASIGRAPTLFRPPYGAQNAAVRAGAARPVILWSVDTQDWKYRDRVKVARTAIAQVRPGDIILMHDIHPTSVAAVPQILTTLKSRGYHFVSVSQLFGGAPLSAGTVYGDNPRAFGRN
ncbi:polysaccharide deacetylase family protein [Actinomadura rudentiformis]|uniref:Polysaccharide deacetylase family protein n=2 Tax=Actinomadura rudentiformis TaxID=359158 RepID=A0A6H9Y724_9ACTN|nr:polysaccharide deacetylase family protein [Actinomadura rudentiformis]